MSEVPHVIVCGAGLTGLTTAWQIRRSGIDVTVLEASDVVGGVMRTTHRDGYLVEQGPNSCMLTAELAALIEALELTPRLLRAAPQAQRRYIVRGGRALAVPASPFEMIRSPLFSVAAKLRVLAEPFIGRRTDVADESVAAFVRRRLGREPLTWAVDPFVSGVYAGDPEQLSVRHAFPRLAALEREHGSLVRGMIAAARHNRASPPNAASSGGRHTMISFADGMATLPLALVDDIGQANILRRSRVVAIARDDDGMVVTVERDGVRRTIRADAVVSTLPLHAFTQITLDDAADAARASLDAIAYPPVVSLALGFRRADVAHPLDGFGCLVPSAENRRTLGVLFSSTLFEQRAPEGHVLLTCFLGGARQADIAMLDVDALVDVVQPELAALLGVTGAPKFVERTLWPQAIPQYNVGHDAAARAADAIEAIVPGLVVDGQFRRGVSVGDCVASGSMIAARTLALAQANADARVTQGERRPVHTPVSPAAVA
ncbi:MAG: protoporphyrinogen oxidase [Gemmatimonadaceae bacterium]|nr:protoporphyrinogen oxidase [Gemmatimonadaceae bacterium]